MVAYTTPDCLPYFEGSDAPCVNTGSICEPSTVWCDFAELSEAILNAFDDAVVVVDNPPLAWVETLVPMAISVDDINDAPVIFTTVRADSASMVDLDVNPTGILIPRTGLYNVLVYVRCTTDIVIAGDYIELGINTTATPAIVRFPSTDTTPGSYQAINLDLVQLAPGASMVAYYEEGQTVSFLLNASGATGGSILTQQISFAVAWLGDVQ